MRRSNTCKAWLGIVVLVVGLASPAAAEIPASSDDTVKKADINGMMTKLGRGIANVVTCPLELIRTPTLVGRRQGYLASLTVGIAQGAWRTVQRGVIGLFEIATFYAEIPDNFEPIMKPEFVHAHGAWSE